MLQMLAELSPGWAPERQPPARDTTGDDEMGKKIQGRGFWEEPGAALNGKDGGWGR